MKTVHFVRIIIVIFLVVGITTTIAYRRHFNVAALENWLTNAGYIAPLMFIVIYIISTTLFLPGSVLTIAGGILFGPIWGTFYNLTGATIGATIAFLPRIIRHLRKC